MCGVANVFVLPKLPFLSDEVRRFLSGFRGFRAFALASLRSVSHVWIAGAAASNPGQHTLNEFNNADWEVLVHCYMYIHVVPTERGLE